MFAHLNDPMPSVRELRPVPDALAELAMAAMSKEPDDRIQSASELAERLLEAADTQSAPAGAFLLPPRPATRAAADGGHPATGHRARADRAGADRPGADAARTNRPRPCATAAHGAARRGGRCRRRGHRRRGRVLVGRLGRSRLRLRLAAAVEHAHGSGPGSPRPDAARAGRAPTRCRRGRHRWRVRLDRESRAEHGHAGQRAIAKGGGRPDPGRHQADSLAEGLGGMWVTNTSDNSVTQLDLGSGKPLGPHAVGAVPEGIVIARGSAGSRTGATGRSPVSTRVATAPPPHPSGAHPFSWPRRPTPCG